MDDVDRKWQENNDAYLAAALGWLRLRLVRLAGHPREQPAEEATPVQESAPIAVRRRWLFGGAATPAPAHAPSPSPSKPAPVQDGAEAAEAAMNQAAARDPAPAAIILQRRFGLSDFERTVLLLCAGVELDTRFASLCARAQDDPSRPYPTFALAFALSDAPAWEALSPGRPLRYWRLLEINQPGSTPLMAAALRADEKVVNYLKGFNQLDERLEPLLEPMSVDAGKLPPSHQALVDGMASEIRGTAPRQRPPVYQLLGPDPASKEMVAAKVCDALGLNLYRTPLALIPPQPAELETIARLWQRETAIAPQALYVDGHNAETSLPTLQRFLARSAGLIFCGLRDSYSELGQQAAARDVDKPAPEEQREEWASALGEPAGDAPGRLAGQFDLNVAEIRAISREAAGAPPGQLADRLWDACLANTRPRLDILAQRIAPKVTLDDVILPQEQSDALRLIASQVRNRSHVYDEWGFRERMNRGLGISALFTGDSGCGKTMAAEALADELRLNLYRIDLSAVVNKYVGETEKNLRRLFDAAEDGGAILFFDEADALFSKRSEVKDSHDRYANIETNYLLQRLESYSGLAILATNMKNALDAAFTRRLRFIVAFPFPGPKEREAIWRKAFPPREPPLAADLDFGVLAKLHLTGANIQSIALNAAFLAAQAGEPAVTMARVTAAARAEFRKFDWPINEADFRPAPLVGARR